MAPGDPYRLAGSPPAIRVTIATLPSARRRGWPRTSPRCSRAGRAEPRGVAAGGGERTPVAVAPARACAFVVLRRVFERGAYADRALRSEAARLDARDRALAMRLAYGAVQRRGTLDHLLEGLAERPTSRA